MNNAGAKNKSIRHYNGHMILEFSRKLNFEGENKITMHCTIDCKSSNISFIKHMLTYFNVLPSQAAKSFSTCLKQRKLFIFSLEKFINSEACTTESNMGYKRVSGQKLVIFLE